MQADSQGSLPASRSLFAALAHRDFRLFTIGQGISLIGTWLQSLALSWLVYRLTHSTLLMGTVSFCTLFPTLPLGPIAGIAADRYSRRHIIISMQTLMMAQAALLAYWTYTGSITTTRIIVLALLLGLVNVFEMTARQSFYVHLVGKEDLPNALAINAMAFNLARVIGPSAGGFLVDRFGEALCFTLNAFSYLAVIISISLIRSQEPRRTQHASPLDHLREGFTYVRDRAGLRSLLNLSVVSNFATAPLMLLAPVFADGIFGLGARGYGILTGTYALGAVVGTLTLARHGKTAGLSRIVWLGAAGVGSAQLLYAVSPVYILSLVCAFVAGFSFLRQLPGTNTLVQSVIDEEYRGRVMALYTMSVTGMIPVGNLTGGFAAQVIGPRWTVACAGFILLAAAIQFGRTRHNVEEALEARR
jgi:MFS family permease